MNPPAHTEYEDELEQLKQVAEKAAFPQLDSASPRPEVPSNEYLPHRRYHIAKRLCWLVTVSLLVLFLLQHPSRFAVEGRIVPVQTRRVAAPFGGQFDVSSAIGVGSVVTEGDLLGRVENWALSDELARKQGELLAMRTSLEAMQTIVRTHANVHSAASQLRGTQLVSRWEIDRAESDYQEAIFRLGSLDAASELTQKQIDRLVTRLTRQELRSPMNGVVLDAWKEANATFVEEGTQLFRIGSRQNRVELRVRDELLGADLKVGDEVVFRLAMMHHKFRGLIVKVNPLVQDSEVVPARSKEPFGTILVDPLELLPKNALPGMHVAARLAGSKPRIAHWWSGIQGLWWDW